jgi:hypothetical protein
VYKGSIVDLVRAAFPNHTFLEWKFTVAPRSFWATTTNQRKFLDWAGKQLKIQAMDDWYHQEKSKVIKLGGLFVACFFFFIKNFHFYVLTRWI